MRDMERCSGSVLTVVGGRVVSQQPPLLVNGQQLMMQLDCLTSAMTDMSVQEEPMEDCSISPESGDNDDCVGMSPYSQTGRRTDPVYLASMASHTLHTQAQMQRQQNALQEQEHLEQLRQQQSQEQQLAEQQLQFQLQLLHLERQHLENQTNQSHVAPADHQVPQMEHCGQNLSLPMESEFHCGSGRVLKRPDLIPMGDFL